MPAHPKTPHLFIVKDRGHSTPCHVWTRAANSAGYGTRRVGDRVVLAHRHAYEQAHGPLPPGVSLDHLCRVRLCVNPDHLEPVTTAENVRRGDRTRLTAAQVKEIRARVASEPQAALAAEFGVDPSWVSRIASGRNANRRGPTSAWAA